MKVLTVISKWNKPGSKRVVEKTPNTDNGYYTKTVKNGLRNMAQCIVQLADGQKVTRHLVVD